jgi:hypothetical protein
LDPGKFPYHSGVKGYLLQFKPNKADDIDVSTLERQGNRSMTIIEGSNLTEFLKKGVEI